MLKQMLFDEVSQLEKLCSETCQTIWNHPETGGHESYSSSVIKDILLNEGFRIKVEEKMPYAFYAEYGEGKPVIAVLGEYDALPGLSQAVAVEKEPLVQGGPGHGCGHNLLGSAAMTACIAVKRVLEREKISGTIRFYGCPEEELLSGKVKMAYYHMFDGCDACISWHPWDANIVRDEAYLASASAHFYFKGRSAHAAAAPHLGRSALDAVELMNIGSNYLREHVIDATRIHYTTDSGGFAPNIVPPNASAWYYVRAPHMSQVKETLERIHKIAQGAALMTETEVTMKIDYGCCELRKNSAFADLTYANMTEADGPKYTEEEYRFARELQKTLPALSESDRQEVLQTGVMPRDTWKDSPMTGSSDSGDMSFIMPTNLFTTACWPLGCSPHTWQTASSSGTSIGEKGALYAAKIAAGIAYDLFTKPEQLKKITEEFQRDRDPEYQPMYCDTDNF